MLESKLIKFDERYVYDEEGRIKEVLTEDYLSEGDKELILKGNKEKWLDLDDIKDYNGVGYNQIGGYAISNFGRVFSYRHRKLMKCSVNNKGYKQVRIYKTSGGVKIDKKVLVHRLVMYAFCNEEYDGVRIINHKDLNKQNNRLSNLEYVSYKENSEHYYRMKKMEMCGNFPC